MPQGKRKTERSKTTKRLPKESADTKEILSVPVVNEKPPVSLSMRPSSNRPFIIALVILGIAILFFLLRNQFIVATVNGQMITRYDLLQELEKKGGKQTLDAMVTQILIRQEAAKQGVMINSDELSAEMAKIESQATSSGQTFDQLLTTYGTTRNEVTEEIRLQKMIEKMVGERVSISDEELNAFIAENKQFLPDEGVGEGAKEQAKEQLKSQKVSTEAQKLTQELKEKANIQYFLEL
ncbi:SurA N-terminal domain-containing protein [Candidatus Roizmanbacteria bacterium]|nr:SurA N-terminal domain-containing protein [Candidatus Roizmanbacteria bacterium]